MLYHRLLYKWTVHGRKTFIINEPQHHTKLKGFIDLLMRIELIGSILWPRLSDFLINLSIYFHMLSYLVTCFPRVTVSLLCRSQAVSMIHVAIYPHHHEWLGSTTTNRHGVAAFDFTTVSGCDQSVVGPTHARSGTLDHLMTDVPDLVRVAVVALIGN